MDVNYLALVPYEQALLHSAEVSTVKFIEAEDFDFDGGSFKTFEEVGLGGSYAGLGAETGIDVNNSGNASELYRVIPGNHPGMADSSWDAERGGGNGFSMEVDFKMGWNDAGDWYNYTRDFPEDGSYAVYGRFSSGGNPVAVDLSVVTAGQGTEDQTLESVGTFTGPATGGWDTMQFFPLKDADGNLATVELSGQSTVRLTILPGNVDMNYLAFVPYVAPADTGPDLVDISNPGDAVVPTSDNHPAGEHAGLAIDDNTGTKYLNFDGANDNASGLTITTGGGVVTGLGLTSANDAPDRDPATFVLSGSNDGATFTEIASGDVPAFGARFERQTVSFDNEADYTTYELIFPTTTGPSTCCMQIAEIELLGTPPAPPAPDNFVANGSFEADDVPEWPGYGDITGWTGGNGINDGGPFGDNGVIPDGAKLGFIQGSHTLSQNLTGLEAGAEYVLAFYYNARNCCGGTIGFTVSVGGEELGSVSDVEPVGGENPYNSASYSFVAAGSDAELVFSTTAAGDATLLLDAVSVSKAGGGDAPALSIVNNGDGTVTVTVEGTLQAAPTVNGPWLDGDGESPLTIPSSEAQQYGRAVSE